MTKEQAIKILDPEHREHYGEIDEVNEACRIGIEAIRKQVKVPVIRTEREYDKYDRACCPNCNVIYDQFDDEWGCAYCPHCGQALGWYSE